ncbi:hypothetical protein [Bradyrhizobium sp. 2]|uniref:hypothetical protein n=1 Tax=Bradyrhizobium sp. 2 TaxID=190045 RepID=UPI001FFAE315|nr:hypothetical protein [Bradyrhizobium sp. 2]
MRNRAVQAFWAMHVEAMNWSGMGVREYAAALSLSPYALRKWRDRLDEGQVEIDWRAHLHPSARPVGVSRRAYCRRHRLDVNTFARWLDALAVSLHAAHGISGRIAPRKAP